MEDRDFEIIQQRIGHDFKNLHLLRQAFVRKSYAKENGGEDNEVLEFIGDKVLDIVIVKLLTDEYGYFCHECDDFDENNEYDEFCCEKSEGELTALKKGLVEKKTLSSVIDRLELNEFLIMGKGDEKNGVRNEASVKEDLFEAIIGAVTLDCEWDWAEITEVIEFMLEPQKRLGNGDENDYVELIREWSLRKSGELPEIKTNHASLNDWYQMQRLGAMTGLTTRNIVDELNKYILHPYDFERTHYISRVYLDGINNLIPGCGRSQSEARKNACENAFLYLKKHDLLFTIRDEIDNPNKDEAISQLEILARRGYFSIPTYKFKQEHDKNGNPVWTAECHIGEYDTYFDAVSSSKKEAKKTAAFEMLQYVIKGGRS